MKISLLTDGIFPYVLGGMQKHSYFIAKYLAQNKVYVDLYHTWANKEYDINKLEYFTDEEKLYIRHFVIDFPKLGKFPGHYLKESYEYSRRVYEVFKKNEFPDFIYIKGFAGWKLIEEKTKGTKFPPIGIKFHGLNMFQRLPNFKAKIEAWMLRSPVMYNLKNSDYIFSYGGKITEITQKIGVPESKIIEIPTGIDASWLKIPVKNAVEPSVRKFIFIGRYERLKGVEELTSAIKSLLSEYNFEFHFVGPIPEKVKIKHKSVVYHGTITDIENIKLLLDSVDCLVCPSYSEGMPNVIIEAMSRGVAIIATDVGAVNYLVSDKNGVLLPECSVVGIEEAIKQVINLSSESLLEMKKEAYNFTLHNLIWDKIGVQLTKEIKNRINDNHP